MTSQVKTGHVRTNLFKAAVEIVWKQIFREQKKCFKLIKSFHIRNFLCPKHFIFGIMMFEEKSIQNKILLGLKFYKKSEILIL